MSKIILALLTLALADCWLGVYLDSRMALPNSYGLDRPDRLHYDGHVATLIHPDGSTEITDGTSGPWYGPGDEIILHRDSANVLVPRHGSQWQYRVYATFTDSANSGFFSGNGYYWRFVWRGHNTPWIVPSFLKL